MGWAATAAAEQRGEIRAARLPETTRPSWRLLSLGFAAVMLTEPLLGALAMTLGEPNPLLRLFWLPVYLALAPIFWADRTVIANAARRTPLLVALALAATLSCVWSVDAATTSRRVLGLWVTMAFGWRLAQLEWPQLLRFLTGVWGALVIGSFAVGLALPAFGIMGGATEHPGAWSGLWSHKNLLGNYMGVGVTLFLAAAVSARKKTPWLLGLIGALILVILSTSATALVLSLLGIGAVGFGVVFRRGPVFALTAGGAAIVAAAAAALILAASPEALFEALGRDATLTGRTDIWRMAIQAIGERPWTGYGFGAFWDVKEGPAFWLRSAVGWAVPNAHSGWLELGLSLGVGAIAIFGLQFAATVLRAVRAALSDPQAGLFAPAFFLLFGLVATTEGYLLQEHNLVWGLYVALAAKLALRRQKAGTEAPTLR